MALSEHDARIFGGLVGGSAGGLMGIWYALVFAGEPFVAGVVGVFLGAIAGVVLATVWWRLRPAEPA